MRLAKIWNALIPCGWIKLTWFRGRPSWSRIARNFRATAFITVQRRNLYFRLDGATPIALISAKHGHHFRVRCTRFLPRFLASAVGSSVNAAARCEARIQKISLPVSFDHFSSHDDPLSECSSSFVRHATTTYSVKAVCARETIGPNLLGVFGLSGRRKRCRITLDRTPGKWRIATRLRRANWVSGNEWEVAFDPYCRGSIRERTFASCLGRVCYIVSSLLYSN